MKRRGWIIRGAAALFCLLGTVVVLWLTIREPVFRGKTESEWVRELVADNGPKTPGNDPMRERFIEMGPEAARFLGKALDRRISRAAETYKRLYTNLPKLPAAILRRIPHPSMDRWVESLTILNLLGRMGTNALPAEPSLQRVLLFEDEGFQYNSFALQIYQDQETPGYGGVLSAMPEQARAERLSGFLDLLVRVNGQKGPGTSERNTMNHQLCSVLRYYPAQAETILPLITNLVTSKAATVRLSALELIVRLDRDAAIQMRAVGDLVGILEPPTNSPPSRPNLFLQIRAVALLGELAAQPEISLPPLIRAAEGKEVNLAVAAIEALGNFRGQADQIVPVLTRILNSYRGPSETAARNALQKLAPERPQLRRNPAVVP